MSAYHAIVLLVRLGELLEVPKVSESSRSTGSVAEILLGGPSAI